MAQVEKMLSSEEWITAVEAVRLLKSVFNSEYTVRMTICQRAHAALIHARAEQFMIDDRSAGEREVPKDFWWAEGHEALKQNWITGDFETWLKHKTRLRAFGVSFLRADIEKMIPADLELSPAQPIAPVQSIVPKGGRPKADWWEDLWIEICRQLYEGILIPKTQADIERAMQQWISNHDKAAGDTTVRDRARKLWLAIKDVGN